MLVVAVVEEEYIIYSNAHTGLLNLLYIFKVSMVLLSLTKY